MLGLSKEGLFIFTNCVIASKKNFVRLLGLCLAVIISAFPVVCYNITELWQRHNKPFMSTQLSELETNLTKKYLRYFTIKSNISPSTFMVRISSNLRTKDEVAMAFEDVKEIVTTQEFINQVMSESGIDLDALCSNSSDIDPLVFSIRFDVDSDGLDDYSYNASYYIKEYDDNNQLVGKRVDNYSTWFMYIF